MTAELRLQNTEELRVLLGPLDRTAKLLGRAFGVTLVHRGDLLKVLGEGDGVSDAHQILEKALKKLRKGYPVTHAEVERWILQRQGGDDGDPQVAKPRAKRGIAHAAVHAPEKERAAGDAKKKLARVKAKTIGQQGYLDALERSPIVFGVGPAGTGKTFLAVAAGVQALRDGLVKRLVLTRPAVEAGERLGFLPGDLEAKVHPYLRPLYDSIENLLEPNVLRRYLENDLIEVCPLAYMRGRTLNHSFIILDEAQNTTIPQMRMFLTRMGMDSRIVVTGDPTQVDLARNEPSGLVDAVQRLASINGLEIIKLGKEDIVRHPIVQAIVDVYESTQTRMPSPEDRSAHPVKDKKRRG
ncbi:MAG: phosphate starvation-inducible protein PhoH [Planctomycetota bacterium]|nr:MAG: phosphate starvation-inducible protein PhoH [Planctomycetota bacterium]